MSLSIPGQYTDILARCLSFVAPWCMLIKSWSRGWRHSAEITTLAPATIIPSVSSIASWYLIFQNGRRVRDRLHLSFGKPLMIISRNSIICLSFWAAISMRSNTGSSTAASDPLMALIRASFAENDAAPSANSFSLDAVSTGALDSASASTFSFPGTHQALNW